MTIYNVTDTIDSLKYAYQNQTAVQLPKVGVPRGGISYVDVTDTLEIGPREGDLVRLTPKLHKEFPRFGIVIEIHPYLAAPDCIVRWKRWEGKSIDFMESVLDSQRSRISVHRLQIITPLDKQVAAA